jgi:hypothetical protein
MSGTLPTASNFKDLNPDGIAKLFNKKGKSELGDVPTTIVNSAARRQIGRGRRDTILSGADGTDGGSTYKPAAGGA